MAGMLNPNPELKRCSKCGAALKKKLNFYRSHNTTDFPDEGYIDECKQCFTMHLNIHQPSTILPLLKLLDIPYIDDEWNKLLYRYEEDLRNGKKSKTALFGQYIGKTRLSQYCDLRFSDTSSYIDPEVLKKINEDAAKLNVVNQYKDSEYDATEVLESLSDIDITTLTEDEIKDLFMSKEEITQTQDRELIEIEENKNNRYDALTTDDKVYLLEKWGQTYLLEQCLKMEKLFLEMMESYDIRSASHIDYLMKICKCSLKMDECLDSNDLDGFNKVSKIYDMLMKAAKFQPVQVQEVSDDSFDSLGKMVALCEKDGFIERTVTDVPKDVVDYTLKDLENYTRKLVMNENNLQNSVELYLNKMIAEEQKKEGKLEEDENEDWSIPEEPEQDIQLTDQDLEDFNSFIEKEQELDLEALEENARI